MLGILNEKKSVGGKCFFLKNKKYIIILTLVCVGVGLFYFGQQKNLNLGFTDTNSSGQKTIQASAMPDRDPDIVGMIDAVNGNQVMVLKFDPSSIPDLPMVANKSNTKKSNSSGNAISLGTSSSGMPGGGPGAMTFNNRSSSKSSSGSSSKSSSSGGPDGFGSSSNRETIMSEIKSASEGKETIEIPIGIPILKDASTGADGSVQQENTSFVNITSDTMVKIWLKKTADGKVQAQFVYITGKVNMNNSNN